MHISHPPRSPLLEDAEENCLPVTDMGPVELVMESFFFQATLSQKTSKAKNAPAKQLQLILQEDVSKMVCGATMEFHNLLTKAIPSLFSWRYFFSYLLVPGMEEESLLVDDTRCED